MTDRQDAQAGLDTQTAKDGNPNSISPSSQVSETLQPLLDASVMQDETGLQDLTEGQVGRADNANKLVYAGATVDTVTNMWTFDAEITVPPGSVNIGSQSISNAGAAMEWQNLSTGEQFLFVSDAIPLDPMASAGDLVRYKLGPETVFDSQTTDLSVISPKTGDDVFYIIPNAADGLNINFSAIGAEAGEFDFFLRLNSHTDLPIFQQRETYTADDVAVATITGITQASNAVVTFDAPHTYTVGQSPVFDQIAGMTEMNLLTGIGIVSTTATTITLDVDSTLFGAYVSGGEGYKEKLFDLTNPNLILGFGTLVYVELRPVQGSQTANRGGLFDLTSIGLPANSYLPWLRVLSRPAEIVSITDQTNIKDQAGQAILAWQRETASFTVSSNYAWIDFFPSADDQVITLPDPADLGDEARIDIYNQTDMPFNVEVRDHLGALVKDIRPVESFSFFYNDTDPAVGIWEVVQTSGDAVAMLNPLTYGDFNAIDWGELPTGDYILEATTEQISNEPSAWGTLPPATPYQIPVKVENESGFYLNQIALYSAFDSSNKSIGRMSSRAGGNFGGAVAVGWRSNIMEADGPITTPVDFVDFTAIIPNPPYNEGRTFYDMNKKALSYYNSEAETTINLAQEVIVQVRNESGATITNGSVVRASGSSTGLPLIDLAQSDTVVNAFAFGVATHDIENNTDGFITAFGSVGGLDTSSYSEGDILYVSGTVAGELTPTQQEILSPVAIVTVSDMTNGTIFVRPRGIINALGVGQVFKDSGSPTQGITTTPEPVSAYDNSAQPAIGVTPTFTASEGNFEAVLSPASPGLSGFYRVSFNASCTYGDSKDIVFTVYVNGSPTTLTAIMPFSSIDPSNGASVTISGITPTAITDTDDVEIYVEATESSGTLTFQSCAFGIERIGNA